MRKNPYDPEYVSIRDNITIEQAVEQIAAWKKKKATSLENYIEKHGEEQGRKLFDEFKKKTLSKGWENIKADGKSYSKFSSKYWKKKGYFDCEADLLAKQHQYNNSPMHTQYWLNKSFSEEEALVEIRKIHDKKKGNPNLKKREGKDSTSLEYFKNKYPELSEEQRMQKYFDKLSAIHSTMVERGYRVPLEQLSEYESYKREVTVHTNISINRLGIDVSNRARIGVPGATNIDHKFSVFAGFMEGIPSEVIGSVHNIELLDAVDNVKKQTKCSITKQELLERYYK